MPSLGGAIACVDNASPRLEKLEIFGSMANLGAGIAISDSDPTISEVYISGTEARNRGAGIYMSNSNSTINATTINGAYAMEVGDILGNIQKGKKANLIITKKIPSINYIPYSMGENNIHMVNLVDIILLF